MNQFLFMYQIRLQWYGEGHAKVWGNYYSYGLWYTRVGEQVTSHTNGHHLSSLTKPGR